MKRPRVTVLGGGFAGLACANGLDARNFDVTLVDRKSHFEFIPNIHELISGVKKPTQLRLPLRSSMAAVGHRFIRADVSEIDAGTRSLQLSNGRTLDAEYLVLACGADDADYGVGGIDTHALRFRSVADGQAAQRRARILAQAGKPAPVVVVGAGLAGVEVVGELLRRHAAHSLPIQLVEARDTLLPGLAPAIGAYVQQRLESAGVSCVTGEAVDRVTPKTVHLASGRRLRSGLTIWTGGPRPPDFFEAAGLAASRQWAAADSYLEHEQFPNVFVAGDSAAITPTISKQAYHALDMGQCVAGNIQARSRKRRLRRYRPAEKPTLLALGDLDTILIAGRRALAGPALAAGKEAVFTAVMTQLDKRSRKDRALALIERGRQARRALLWPALTDWKSLQQQARVQPIL